MQVQVIIVCVELAPICSISQQGRRLECIAFLSFEGQINVDMRYRRRDFGRSEIFLLSGSSVCSSLS